MVVTFKVTVNDKKVRDLINNRMTKLPDRMGEGGLRFMKKLRGNLQKEVVRRKLVYKGDLYSTMYVRARSKNSSELHMRQYGVYLNEAKPHWVSLKRGRKITAWARSRGIRAKSLYVFSPANNWRYKGWIDDTFKRTILQLRPDLKRVVTRTLKGG